MNNNQPLVTVYITNYNYGRYIKQAVESVLAQTLQDFEIIIIDDGSTDDSRSIIEKYESHPQIEVIFQKNKGLNVTNNIAMRLAQGKYLMRLDADDYLVPEALEKMIRELESDSELGLVFPDYYLINDSGDVIAKEQRHSFKEDVSLLDQPAHGACTMIRLNFLEELGGYNENFSCQDGYDLWIKFIARFKVGNINLPLFYYRQHGSNLTKNEQKILNTRAKIKENYVKNHDLKILRTIAIIPVRGYGVNSNSVALEDLGGELILDKKIRDALRIDNLEKVVITSPDQRVRNHVKDKFAGNGKVMVVKRARELARLNIDLKQTVKEVLDQPEIIKINPEAFITLSIEFPFASSVFISDAIYTMSIFDTDCLISVRPDNSLFFQHHGNGMKAILNQDKFTRLEREALYRYSGGIIMTKCDYFKSNNEFLGGQIGHIVIDEKAAHGVRSRHDLHVARFLNEGYEMATKV